MTNGGSSHLCSVDYFFLSHFKVSSGCTLFRCTVLLSSEKRTGEAET